jgi:hypothetical protein
VPLHTPTVLAPRRTRLGLIAALAATCATAGAATIVIADDQSTPQIHTIGVPSQPALTRYFDIEANKAISMRALGRRIAEQQANRTSRYDDLAANKARSRHAR